MLDADQAQVAARGTGAAPVLNDNGGWCWFQDERAIFTHDGRLMVSSVPDRAGADGVSRDGGTEVTSLDLRDGSVWTDTLYKGLVSDDHNAAALLELPKRTLGFATDHSSKPDIYRARLERGGLGWVPDPPIHRPEAAVYDPALGRNSGVTYSNLSFLAQENGGNGRVYDMFRSAGETQYLITSDDQGKTWNDRGRIFTPFRAYVRMVSDGQRRIWFAITDGHPNNFGGTSLYGGYIEGDAVHRSDGSTVAPLGQPVDPADLTLIFKGTKGTTAEQIDAWGADIALDAEGRPVVTFSTTIPGRSSVPDKRTRHEARYARWDGAAWQEGLMGNAGSELYLGQRHYTGLSTIDPADPTRVFLSTDQHPVTGVPLVSGTDGQVHHEIFEGRTSDGGLSWSWDAVTSDSTQDNLRPIVPNPKDGNWALIWMRGDYDHALVYDLTVVAIVNPDGPGTLPAPPARVTTPSWGVRSTTPLASDLDGNGHDDLTFFGPGEGADVQVSFLEGNRRRSVYRRQSAPTSTRPVTGDFDGNGKADILWYVPDATSTVWWGSSTANPESAVVEPPSPVAKPATGDFDGDGRDDIFWYAAGSEPDEIWWGRGDRTFTPKAASVSGHYQPLVGDLDGDGRDDILWYAPGTATDSLWWANTGRAFTPQRLAIMGVYRGASDDVDGDGHDEVIWHAPGSTTDRRWDFRSDRTYSSQTFQVYGSYQPVTGDFDGDGSSDLLWSTPSTGAVNFVHGNTSYLD